MRALDPERADSYLELICGHVRRPYPWSPGHLLDGPEELDAARLHPAFHGSLDWHSCVHSHWALVHLLRRYPDAPHAGAARAVLDADLTESNIATELQYVREHATFERPYGWVWLLQLAVEIRDSAEAARDRWHAALAPLELDLGGRLLDYLRDLRRPVRIGLHANTAFAIQLALDYATRTANADLADLCRTRAVGWFATDRAYPIQLEPLGPDFLSAGLTEAALMGATLDAGDFAGWLSAFLPELGSGDGLEPMAGDEDAHLQGFDLSRAWSLGLIAAALPAEDPRREALRSAQRRLLEAGLARVGSGDYMADHWLATFALLALDALI